MRIGAEYFSTAPICTNPKFDKDKQMIACIDTKEVAEIQSKNSSKKRIISAVQGKYSALQFMVSGKSGVGEIECEEAFEKQSKESEDLLKSLEADDALKAMLATQMAVIHELQQKEFLFASQNIPVERKQYHINAITKLSNVFIQQATLMQKLQGKGQQKVTVEHVHVHNGGQAIVGNVKTNAKEG